MPDPHQWTPDLLDQLVDTIPRLVKSKKALLDLFQGAGVSEAILKAHRDLLAKAPADFSKFPVARTVLIAVNNLGDSGLGPRRELLKRVTTFETFANCYDNEREKAELGVRRVRELVDKKDSFTEMRIEKEREAEIRRAQLRAKVDTIAARDRELDGIRSEFAALYGMASGVARGNAFERALNRLFRLHGLLTKDSFRLRNENGVVLEQIDGVIELDGMTWLIEAKWWEQSVDVPAVGHHLCRVMIRPPVVGALMISGGSYTVSAVATAKQALANRPVALMTLTDLWQVIDKKGDLMELMRRHTRAAKTDLNPYLGQPVQDTTSPN